MTFLISKTLKQNEHWEDVTFTWCAASDNQLFKRDLNMAVPNATQIFHSEKWKLSLKEWSSFYYINTLANTLGRQWLFW